MRKNATLVSSNANVKQNHRENFKGEASWSPTIHTCLPGVVAANWKGWRRVATTSCRGKNCQPSSPLPLIPKIVFWTCEVPAIFNIDKWGCTFPEIWILPTISISCPAPFTLCLQQVYIYLYVLCKLYITYLISIYELYTYICIYYICRY